MSAKKFAATSAGDFATRASSGRAKLSADVLALRRTGEPARHRIGMDMTWLTDRIAVGGGLDG